MAKNTLFDDMVTAAGGVNVASSLGLSHWPKVDTELLLKMDPYALIILEPDSLVFRKNLKTHPAWGRLSAVKAERYIFLEPKYALSASHYLGVAVSKLRAQWEVLK